MSNGSGFRKVSPAVDDVNALSVGAIKCTGTGGSQVYVNSGLNPN